MHGHTQSGNPVPTRTRQAKGLQPQHPHGKARVRVNAATPTSTQHTQTNKHHGRARPPSLLVVVVVHTSGPTTDNKADSTRTHAYTSTYDSIRISAPKFETHLAPSRHWRRTSVMDEQRPRFYPWLHALLQPTDTMPSCNLRHDATHDMNCPFARLYDSGSTARRGHPNLPTHQSNRA